MSEDTDPDKLLEVLSQYINDDENVVELWNLENLAATKLAEFLDEVHKSIVSFFLSRRQLTCLQLIMTKLGNRPKIKPKVISFLGSLYGSRVALPPFFMLQGVEEVTDSVFSASEDSHIVRRGTWESKEVQIKPIDLDEYDTKQEEVCFVYC